MNDEVEAACLSFRVPRSAFRLALLVLLALAANVAAQNAPARPLSVAILDFGETSLGRRAADRLATTLAAQADLALADRDESRAAARGAGYAGSLNLTLSEARDLGSALGADFYLLGDAQTVRRSPSDRPFYFEAYLSIFLVSTRTGRLVMWERPSFEAASPEAAEKLLLTELDQRATRYVAALRAARERERTERAQALEHLAPLINDAPEEGSAAAAGLRLPAPYRRLQPAYPDTASRDGAEATVDVQVLIDADGEISAVEVVRWAGYGLDEATINTVRQLHFRPATRDGLPIPLRVLLRYNFRRPPPEGKR
jgi:TonB family protein